MFGAYPGGNDDDRIQSMQNFETQIGRQLDYVRVFEVWDSPFPTNFHNQLISSDRTMLLSVRAKRLNGSFVPWRDIANAQPGSALHNQMVTWIERVRAVGEPVWFTFNHEPEIVENISNGVDADFIAAWRKVISEFRARGVTNATFVWIMTDWSFEVASSDRRSAPKWYPGDAYVDWIAADAYNWSSCRAGMASPWRTLEQIVTPLKQFGAAHPAKSILLAEWASAEQGGSKAGWIDAVGALFKKPGWEQFVGISYFNRIDANFPNCNFPVASTTASLDAFKRVAADPFYNGTGGPPPPPPPPPPGTIVHSGTVDSSNATAPRWSSGTFTPTASGSHLLKLEWPGSANLRIEVRRDSDNAWVGANTTTSQPKSLSVNLVSGGRYRVAVWSVVGVATFTVAMTAPGSQQTPPQLTMTAPLNGATVGGNVVVSAAVTPGTGTISQVVFTAAGTAVGTDTNGVDGWSATWDSTTAPEGPAMVAATATDSSGLTATGQVTVTVDNAPSSGVVMVVADPGALVATENAVRQRLLGLGYAVTIVDDDGVTAAAATGAALVLLSHTVGLQKVAATFRPVTTTVWTAKPWLFDDMALTGPAANVDYGSTATSTVVVTAPAHPMAAGRSGTVTLTTSRDNVSWGRPGAAATTVAVANGKATMFAYQPGAALVGGAAAAGCRIAFPLYLNGPTRFTAAAWAMFDATAAWGASGC